MSRSFFTTLTTALCGLSLLNSAFAITPRFPYGTQKLRGVNIGGWLVLEPWVTPSLFDKTGNDRIVDEWTFAQLQNRDTALAALKQHWDTWITEQDFIDIAAAGLNHVRIPIGYWAFEVAAGEPYIDGQLPYLEKAIGWASKYGLKVIVDLHGAPGSQNGFDNSGQKMDTPQWAANANNVVRTKAVLKRIADLYKDRPDVVPIINALNEPAGYRDGVLPVAKQYSRDSYDILRSPYGDTRKSDTVVMLHDAFQPIPSWNGFFPSPQYEGVMFDTHPYEMFLHPTITRGFDEHIRAACARGNEFASYASYNFWTVAGEWTPASTDCARELNGRGTGSRWEGKFQNFPVLGSCKGFSGSGATFSTQYKEFLRKHWEAQVMAFEKAAGWIQWTWKAETADDWSYQAGLQYGWIPKNPTDYKYPDICTPKCDSTRKHVRF